MFTGGSRRERSSLDIDLRRGVDALVIDPVFKVLSCNSPLSAELDGRKSTRPQLARYDERGHIHVLADISDRKPVLVDVDGDAIHVPFLPDSAPGVHPVDLPLRMPSVQRRVSIRMRPTRSLCRIAGAATGGGIRGDGRMKIEATTVEAHRFARVRRKGYDPVEVDRVMDRLVTTLRAHEQDTADLEDRVAVADDSVDAIRRTFAAAQRTRDEMINESAARAATIIEDANGEAGRITESARTEAEAVMFERDEAIIQTHREGAERMAEAEAASHRLLLDAEMARSDAVTLTEQALEHNGARIEAMKTAAAVEAERHANEIVGAARREEIRLTTRLGDLRTAVGEVESKINDLAALTTSHTTHIADVIDLTVIDGEALGIGLGRS